jgi:uncharacterized protein GlcG (DUF336 family)
MAAVIQKSSIGLDAANRVVAAGVAYAASKGHAMVVSVVDESGVLKAFARMDGAPLLSVDLAHDKAWTAVSFGIATHEWFDFVRDDPPLLHGIVKTRRLIVFGGGFPIRIDGAVVGGIGVSGGHYSQDMEVARAALAALA